MSCVNSDNFLAVALIINRSSDGPAFVFHYPPEVRPVNENKGDEAAVDLEDILLERLAQTGSHHGITASEVSSKHRHHDDHHHHHGVAGSGTQLAPWERVAGFPTRDLASILTPAKSYHKTLFQLSLDPLYCVSYPIHVPENGKWAKPKKSSKDKKVAAPKTTATEDGAAMLEMAPSASEALKDKDKDGNSKKEDADEEKRSSMNMFNLVFILNPKKNETRELVDSLYSNIVKKVNKAYQYSQQHSDFVWKESKRILAIKDRAREEGRNMNDLWKELLSTFSLAASVHDIYEAVSQNKVATLHLETTAGTLSPSVQIPAPFYVSDVLADDDRRHRGLWLTTANAFLSQDLLEEPGFLDKNFALLLMDDEKKIISELQIDQDPATIPMVEFVRLSKPTLSFYQVAQSNILSLSQVRKYAQHFIFWRRAIAIPPLHARDTFIVSPNCDLSRLVDDTVDWQREFPVAPPLPNFLAELSACPRPYKSFCPSKVHRPLYLRMLAFLLRGGWVTQLCTFAYVVVWPEILYEVEYEMEAEELGPTPSASPPSAGTTSKTFYFGQSPRNDSATATPDESIVASPKSGSSQQTQQPSSIEQAAEAARLERIAQRAERAAADKATAHARKTIPITTPHPSTNTASHLAHLTPHIILDAKKATGKESRYLSAIGRRLRDKDDKVGRAWPGMCRYFDGHTALERVALMQDLKKKEAWSILSGFGEYLTVVRHW